MTMFEQMPPFRTWIPKPATGFYTTGLFNHSASLGKLFNVKSWDLYVVAVPCILPWSIVCSHICFYVTTLDVGVSLRVGIYADNDGAPGALVEDAGTGLLTTTGGREVALAANRTLGPGRIWLALCTENGTDTGIIVAPDQASVLPIANVLKTSGVGGNGYTSAGFYWSTGASADYFTALPTTFPAMTLDTSSAMVAPHLALKVA